MSASAPPLLRRLLACVLPPGPVRDGLLGDLDELYAERVRARRSADLWYARQVISAAMHYPLRRLLALGARGSGGRMIERLGSDIGYAVRTLRRRPGFTAVVVLTLALGIGANTSVFSVVRSVLLRPLPFPDDERLAVVLMRAPIFNFEDMPSSPPEYVAYRDHARSWDQLAAFQVRSVTVTEDGGEPERISVALATGNFFPVMGREPLLGRLFTRGEDVVGSEGVAILSHAFWMTRYGGDRGVIGRTVRLDGVPRTIAGVMPPDFRYPTRDVRFWLPITFTAEDLQYRGNHSYSVIGRLRPGVTLASAERELDRLVERFKADPSFNFHEWHPVYLRSLRREIVGDVRWMLWVMQAAVALVLVIACANVANLLLIRAEERAREMSVRIALGAGRARLTSQLFTESLVIAAAGGMAGVAVAYLGVEALRSVAPADLPRVHELRLDASVLAFTMLVTLGAGMLFGLVPALYSGRADVHGVLREEGRTGMAGRRRVRLRQLLVVSETALAVVLLVGAGLLLQSFRRLAAVDPGYETESLITATLTVPAIGYDEGREVVGFYQRLLPRIASLPGVDTVGAAVRAPLAGGVGASDIEIEGWVNPGDAPRPIGHIQAVTPGFFSVMGISILEGRDFAERDDLDAPLVAIVSEELARSYWPGRSPLGGRIRVDGDTEQFAQVIGVVPDVRYARLDSPPARGTLYLAHAQTPLTWDTRRSMTLAVRTSVDPTSLVTSLRREVQAMDGSVPVYEVRTMEQAVADSTATQRFSTLLQLLFALIALLLAAVGLYGVLSFTVARRTAEIGIRMALGAARVDVQRMVVRQGMGIVAIAIALGVTGALATGRVLASLLYGVSPRDPITYATVVGVLVTVALFACWIPARRASGVDPVQALRAQ